MVTIYYLQDFKPMEDVYSNLFYILTYNFSNIII